MLIGLIGPRGAGKKSMAAELARRHGFRRIAIGGKDEEDALVFQSAQEALEFTTANWTLDFITTDLRARSDILPFVKRPWFILVFLQARLLDRWARIQADLSSDSWSHSPNSHIHLTFERFVIEEDVDEFGARPDDELKKEEGTTNNPIAEMSQKVMERKVEGERGRGRPSALRSLTSFVSHWITNDLALPEFLESLAIHLPIIRKSVRPCWDTYFTSLANLASLRSNCMKRRVGAVLVTRDNRIVSTGYNGTPRGMTNCNEGGCARCNGQNHSPHQVTNTNVVASCGVNLEECLCLHAEENALLEAGRDRTTNSRLYCNTCPCLRCTIKIVQCGVQEVIYSQSYSMDQQATKIFLEAGVKLRQFDS